MVTVSGSLLPVVDTTSSAARPAIVVLDRPYFDIQEIAERLKKDAGIKPLFPKLSFNPSEGARQRQLNALAKIYGKPVIFVDQYPLACHWESGLVCFQLLNEAKKAIIDQIQAENEWFRSALTKEERPNARKSP